MRRNHITHHLITIPPNSKDYQDLLTLTSLDSFNHCNLYARMFKQRQVQPNFSTRDTSYISTTFPFMILTSTLLIVLNIFFLYCFISSALICALRTCLTTRDSPSTMYSVLLHHQSPPTRASHHYHAHLQSPLSHCHVKSLSFCLGIKIQCTSNPSI